MARNPLSERGPPTLECIITYPLSLPYSQKLSCGNVCPGLTSVSDRILLIMTWSYCYNFEMKQDHSVFQSPEKLSILVHAFAQSNHCASPRLSTQKLSRLHISSAVPCLIASPSLPPPIPGLITHGIFATAEPSSFVLRWPSRQAPRLLHRPPHEQRHCGPESVGRGHRGCMPEQSHLLMIRPAPLSRRRTTL